jgi:NAD(P)-dependent dehydrogenase (short-subunit alcohol dehydrogenase family)
VIRDFTGKTVLVTGGTMGIGLECALGFAKYGAKCVLTYKWGTADEDGVLARFAAIGAVPPDIFRADAGNDEDTAALMEHLCSMTSRVEVFVSNVSAALVVGGLKDYSRKALFRSIEYSAWPMFGYTLQMFEALGTFPRYVIGMSSIGVDSYSRGYDFMAASKAVMETLCRYFDYHLRGSDVRINVIRGYNVRTLAFRDTFGKDFEEFASRFSREEHALDPKDVADVVLALASGLLDGISGQVITVDRGITFFDNVMRLYEEREQLGLTKDPSQIVLTGEKGPHTARD